VKPVRYLFIDGGCLREALKRYANLYTGGKTLQLDYKSFTEAHAKVFYYDALPGRLSGESQTDYEKRTAPDRAFFDRLGLLDRFHVYEGDVRRSSARRRNEQKKIDILIAVDVLTHTFLRNMDEAVLLTGDLDFKPLIDSLVLQGMKVTLWYPPGSTSSDLISAADFSLPLSITQIHAALLIHTKSLFNPPSITGRPDRPDGIEIWRDTTADREISLLQYDGLFILLICDANQSSRYMQYSHADMNLLRNFADTELRIRIP
jgi:uncharacterized LabA/DUF88 family protein